MSSKLTNFVNNSIFNFASNSAAALVQQAFTGNLFDPKPFDGTFNAGSLFSNLLPNTVAGWSSDQFNSWNP